MSNQFNYNLNSINFFIQENSGSITGVTTSYEDYGDVQGLPVQSQGQIWLPEREESIHDFSFDQQKFFNTFDSQLTRFNTNLELEDWGADLTITETIYPFGTLSTANLAGLAETFSVGISGLAVLFRAIGNLGIKFTPKYPASGLITLSGDGGTPRTRPYIASGTLFKFGTAGESKSFDFVGSGLKTLSGVAVERTAIGDDQNTILFDFLDAAETAPVVIWGVDEEVGGTITILGELTHPDIDYTPHYGIEKNIGIGTTGIQISGTTSALEAFSAQTPEDTILFSFGSTAVEKFGGDPPENSQLFSFSGEIEIPLRTFAEQPTGTINVSGELVEKQSFDFVGSGSFTPSDSALEAYSAQTPEDIILFGASGTAIQKATVRELFFGVLTFSGAATNEQFTGDPPEETILFNTNGDAYVIRTRDKVGTGLASLSGIASCREIASYGYYGDLNNPGTSGLLTISGASLENPDSGVTYIPHYGIERNIGVGTTGIQIEPSTRFGFNTGLDADGNERGARYYSNVYPRNDIAELDGGSGTGGFRLNDDKELTFTRALLPYKASGLGVFSGTGNEAFCIVGYEGDAGTTFFSGAAETRQIDVFGFYGDDADPGTTGLFTISDQTQGIIFRRSFAQLAEGSLFATGGNSDIQLTYGYQGEGQLSTLSGTAEAFGADEVQNVVLYDTHGHASESFVAQPTEDTAQFTYQGQLESEKTTKSYLGQVAFPTTIGGAAESIERNVVGTVLFSFDTGTTDSEVRKVDSSISVDRDDVALNAFVKQTEDVARTILFDITNSAETVLNTLKVYDATGSTTLSGAYSELKFSATHVGLGGLTKHGVAVKKQVFGYVGEGSLNTLTGASENFARESTTGTILYSATGSATTKIESDFTYASAGTFLPTGAATEIRYVPLYPGSGTITLSGELTHPEIRFIPAVTAGGLSTVSGAATVANVIVPFTSGRFFGIGSGDEAYARNTYVGIGSMSITDEGTTIEDPFRIPRTFTIIV